MKFKKPGGRKNYGYGNSLKYAVRCALLDRYGTGRYGTQRTQRSRLKRFLRFLRDNGINDFRQVDEDVVLRHAASLRSEVERGELAIATAVNAASAVNTLMAIVRGDSRLSVSPRKEIGPRTYVRKEIPVGIDPGMVASAADHLVGLGEHRLAGVLRVCRTLGLRFREASLLCISDALEAAKRSGSICVTKGTKGGRARTVSADSEAIEALDAVSRSIQIHANVIPPDWNYIRWSRYAYRTWRKYAHLAGLSTKFSALRASLACDLYRTATGVESPVIAGGRVAARSADRNARLVIARELGHQRCQIAASYIGTSKAKSP